MKFKSLFLGVIAACVSLPVYAGTTVLVNNGAAYVTSTESGQYLYQGYMRLRTDVNVAGYIYTDGWIQYSGSSTKRAYTQRTGHELQEAHLSYQDSLNPWASKTRFNYDYRKIPVGGNIAERPEIELLHENGELVY